MPAHTGAERLPDELEDRFRPLQVAVARAWWGANVAASPATERAREEAELALREALGDAAAFARVRDALDRAGPDGVGRRRLEALFRQMLPNQVPAGLRRRIVALEARVDSVFATHRGELGGERVDDNEVARILGSSEDADLRRAAWEAAKSVGGEVAPLVLELVGLRNQAAAELGYADHWELALAAEELDGERLAATLAAVEAATAGPFAAWKAGLDAERASRFGCRPEDLRPWHYDDPFFQDPPRSAALDLDSELATLDPVAVAARTYDGLGLDVAAVLAASDLEPREGKSQHAFCLDVDREGDVRVLANVTPGERWCETMLHELGHAVYDRNLDPALPFGLRAPAHMLTTEAVAMLLGRLVREPAWLADVAGLDGDRVAELAPALAGARRAAALVFARWALVMVHFERGFYAEPGADHARRWWDLVERFQLVPRPEGRHEPDWAAKVHLAAAPVYYQNYLLGELVASQLEAALGRDTGGLVGRPQAGAWLVERVFRPGASRRWDHLVAEATGGPLDPRWFVAGLG